MITEYVLSVEPKTEQILEIRIRLVEFSTLKPQFYLKTNNLLILRSKLNLKNANIYEIYIAFDLMIHALIPTLTAQIKNVSSF